MRSAREIVTSYEGRIANKKVFFGSSIPPRKLHGAISSYALGCMESEEKLFLCDCTMLGSATDGLLLTDKCLYAHDVGKSPQKIFLREISECHLEGLLATGNLGEFLKPNNLITLLVPSIHVNGLEFVRLTIGAPATCKAIGQMLKDVVEACGSRAQSVAPEPMARVTPVSSICHRCGAPRGQNATTCEFCGSPLSN